MSKKKTVEEPLKTEFSDWLNEEVVAVPDAKGPYKLACAILGRKMTYKELIAFIEKVNVRKLDKDKLFEAATKSAIAVYEQNNGKLPDGVKKVEV